jgi:hypothetical protein
LKANFGAAEVKPRSGGRKQKTAWLLRSLLK